MESFLSVLLKMFCVSCGSIRKWQGMNTWQMTSQEGDRDGYCDCLFLLGSLLFPTQTLVRFIL